MLDAYFIGLTGSWADRSSFVLCDEMRGGSIILGLGDRNGGG
jgi:hypothetical protein